MVASDPKFIDREEEDEVKAHLYDAIGHLEAAAAKLGLCSTTARPPRSSQYRAWSDELVNMIEDARAEHAELMAMPPAATEPTHQLSLLPPPPGQDGGD